MSALQLPSLRELDNEIIALEKKRPRTAIQKAEVETLKKEFNRAYNRLKRIVMEFEKTNMQYLVLMPSTKGFRKMFGHSALFYALHIARRVNLHANLQTDTDYDLKSDVGYVSVRNMTKIEPRLANQLEIKRCSAAEQPEGLPRQLIVYRLPWKFSPEELDEFETLYNSSLDEFNRSVLSDNVMPVLYLSLVELNKAVHENLRRLPHAERELCGVRLSREASDVVHKYFYYTNGSMDREEFVNFAQDTLLSLEYRVKEVSDLGIWSAVTTARIAKHIIKIRDILNVEAKMIAKAKRDAERAAAVAKNGASRENDEGEIKDEE